MRKTIVIAGLVAACSTAGAFERRCTTSDLWRGPDKTKHAIGGAAIGAAVTAATREPLYGLAAGALVAAVKEAVDRRSPSHTCSLQDFAVTLAGAAAGSYGTALLVLPQSPGVQVLFSSRF